MKLFSKIPAILSNPVFSNSTALFQFSDKRSYSLTYKLFEHPLAASRAAKRVDLPVALSITSTETLTLRLNMSGLPIPLTTAHI